MSNFKIPYLTYECTCLCNMECPFCFSAGRLINYKQQLTTSEALQAITIFKNKYEIRTINLTGGDPFLRDDLETIVKFCKEKLKLKVAITTNGILLERYLDKICQYVDFIGLPLDSSLKSTHEKMRPTAATTDHQALILSLIDKIINRYTHIKLKVNTLVCALNYEDVPKIGRLLPPKLLSWKLSQFIPSIHAEKVKNIYSITREEFQKIYVETKSQNPHLQVVAQQAQVRDIGCRILTVNGDIQMPQENQIVTLGNIFTSSIEEILEGFNHQVNSNFYQRIYERAYELPANKILGSANEIK